MDQKLDNTTAHLQQMEELMYFALMMLKRINPSSLAGTSDPTCPSDPADQHVATETPQEDLEPPIATASQPKSSPSKKGKKKFFSCFFFFFFFFFFSILSLMVFMFGQLLFLCGLIFVHFFGS